jgi:YD repeat-containing protein
VTTTATYQPSDNMDEDPPLASLTDHEGVVWNFTYDDSGSLSAITNGANTTSYTRIDQNRVSRITDALGHHTDFIYVPSGISQFTTPAGRTQSYIYDTSGRTASWTRSDNTTITYQYSSDSISTSLPGGDVYELLSDDRLGLVVNRGAPGGTVNDWRDDVGRTTLLQLDDGAQTAVTYTAEGHVAAVTATTPAGTSFTTNYAYDTAGHVASITDPNSGVTHYTYDVQGRLTRIDRPNNTSTILTVGALDRPALIQHFSGTNLVASYGYTYDTHGRVTAAVTPQGSFQYQYDSLSRLNIEQTMNGATVVATRTRTYDAVGNLVTLVDGTGTTTYSYDADDRLVSASGPAGTTSYTYNGRGALTLVTGPGGTSQYTYDDLDRLTSITNPDGTMVSYQYDAQGRRLSRTDDGGTRRCLPLPQRPDGYDDCAVRYSSTGPEQPEALVFGPTGLASVHGAASDYVLAANQNDVVGVTDAAGNVIASFGYDPWGVRVATTGSDPGYGYGGERQESSNGLVFLRAR